MIKTIELQVEGNKTIKIKAKKNKISIIFQNEENETKKEPKILSSRSDTMDKILNLIKENKTITRNEMAKAIGLTPDGIKYHLDRLKKTNIIKHQGPTKKGHWEIMEENNENIHELTRKRGGSKGPLLHGRTRTNTDEQGRGEDSAE